MKSNVTLRFLSFVSHLSDPGISRYLRTALQGPRVSAVNQRRRLNMRIGLLRNLQRQFSLPQTIRIPSRAKTLLATAVLSALWVPGVAAGCGWSAQRMPPGVFSAVPLPQLQAPTSGGALAEVPEGGNGPSMTGLWKTVFVADGAVVNLGFNTWHSDGTEWALDQGPPVSGQVCPGVWEKIGNRTYATVHPAFNYDATNTYVVGILIERLNVTISSDANSYAGTFTWDSFDLEGNLLPGTRVVGTITGTRIKVGTPFPFPFPQ